MQKTTPNTYKHTPRKITNSTQQGFQAPRGETLILSDASSHRDTGYGDA